MREGSQSFGLRREIIIAKITFKYFDADSFIRGMNRDWNKVYTDFGIMWNYFGIH